MTPSRASGQRVRADRQDREASDDENALRRLSASERLLLTEALAALLEEETAEQSWLSALRSPFDSEVEEDDDDAL